jgi:hypothetical protein
MTTEEVNEDSKESGRDSPLIVSYHFERRYEAFFKKGLKPKFLHIGLHE